MKTRSLALLSSVALVLGACGEGAEATADEAVAPTEIATVAPAEGEAPQADEAQAPTVLPEPEGSLATNDMAIGDPDAPLTVIEYASVTCPACAMFHETYFPSIKEELVEPGLVRFVYRELPTGPRSLSYAGSILARCAATDAGAPAYFAVNDALFSRQREWVYGQDPGQALESIFAQIGMDRAAMETCLRRGALKTAIDENAERAQEAGVASTPTLIVGGERFELGRKNPEEVVAELKALAEAAQ